MVAANKRIKTKKRKKPKKINNLRHAEYYDMQETFDGLYAKSIQSGIFDNLMCLISLLFSQLLLYSNLLPAIFVQ